jgi:hypothetical protein
MAQRKRKGDGDTPVKDKKSRAEEPHEYHNSKKIDGQAIDAQGLVIVNRNCTIASQVCRRGTVINIGCTIASRTLMGTQCRVIDFGTVPAQVTATP